jgi:hypothetical protein
MTEKEFKGKVFLIDMEKRTITMKDDGGAVHPFKWTEPLDVVMRKWKAGYYLTLTHDADTYLLKNAVYWQEGSAVFPKPTGGKSFAPRNEKSMIFESVFKSCCDLAQTNPEDFKQTSIKGSYEQKMDRIWSVAKKISLEIIKESGA